MRISFSLVFINILQYLSEVFDLLLDYTVEVNIQIPFGIRNLFGKLVFSGFPNLFYDKRVEVQVSWIYLNSFISFPSVLGIEIAFLGVIES